MRAGGLDDVARAERAAVEAQRGDGGGRVVVSQLRVERADGLEERVAREGEERLGVRGHREAGAGERAHGAAGEGDGGFRAGGFGDEEVVDHDSAAGHLHDGAGIVAAEACILVAQRDVVGVGDEAAAHGQARGEPAGSGGHGAVIASDSEQRAVQIEDAVGDRQFARGFAAGEVGAEEADENARERVRLSGGAEGERAVDHRHAGEPLRRAFAVGADVQPGGLVGAAVRHQLVGAIRLGEPERARACLDKRAGRAGDRAGEGEVRSFFDADDRGAVLGRGEGQAALDGRGGAAVPERGGADHEVGGAAAGRADGAGRSTLSEVRHGQGAVVDARGTAVGVETGEREGAGASLG